MIRLKVIQDREPEQVTLPTREHPRSDPTAMDRRGALKWMGATIALATGIPGCVRKPPREVISREDAPEYRQPGQPLHYASTYDQGPQPYGILVKTVEGRPVKIEGNPDDPVSAGRSTAAIQASILSLYDPGRLRAPRGAATWQEADTRIREALGRAASIVLLTRTLLGPSERAQVDAFLERYPKAKHFTHEPLSDRQRRETWRALYGQDGVWLPRFDRAQVILSVGSDFLASDGVELEAARQFADARDAGQSGPPARMPRLYVVESELSLTGTNSDHRIRIKPSLAGALVGAIRRAVGGEDIRPFAAKHHLNADGLSALVEDLRSHRGESLVLAGPAHPGAVHAAVALLNHELGSPGNTLSFDPEPATLPVTSPADVEGALAGGVDVLICLGVNPAYDWRGGGFDALIRRAKLSVGHGLYLDETLSLCTLALPSHHYLESWNDAAPRPGLRTLGQPVISPLFSTRQEAESLLIWSAPAGTKPGTFRAAVESETRGSLLATAANVTLAWQQALQRGVIRFETGSRNPGIDRPRAEALASTKLAPGKLELVLLPHSGTYDGRYGSHPWLLEVPDPVTKLMWDNAALVSASTRRELGVQDGDVIAIQAGEARVELPVLAVPGMADSVVAVAVGLGRSPTTEGQPRVGVNAYPLMPSAARIRTDASVTPTGKHHQLVLSQPGFSMQHRPLVLDATAAELAQDPKAIQRQRKLPDAEQRLYPPWDYSSGQKWGMTIDLNRCTGCNACVIACQAENNIPTVGKEECANGREMFWMRLDQYREGEDDDLEVHHQPMLCQHCDNAPCENVCPVNATNHSPSGLNVMVYNRCIGTRYCGNNCPYKVRRFNFYDYQGRIHKDPVQKLAMNPNVTVRTRGVMEKCTFCVQRINAANFAAKNAGRPVRDGEVVPACAQACPAQAITFGDLNGAGPEGATQVALKRKSRRSFQVLEETLVQPNVTYLGRVRNPVATSGAALTGQAGEGGEHG